MYTYKHVQRTVHVQNNGDSTSKNQHLLIHVHVIDTITSNNYEHLLNDSLSYGLCTCNTEN